MTPHTNDNECEAYGCGCMDLRTTPWRCTNCNHERLHVLIEGNRHCTRNGCTCINFQWNVDQKLDIQPGHLVTVQNLQVVVRNEDMVTLRGGVAGATITVSINNIVEHCEAPPHANRCGSTYKDGIYLVRCSSKEGHNGHHTNADTLNGWYSKDEAGKFISTNQEI